MIIKITTEIIDLIKLNFIVSLNLISRIIFLKSKIIVLHFVLNMDVNAKFLLRL